MKEFRVILVEEIVREKTFFAECQEDIEDMVFYDEDFDTWDIVEDNSEIEFCEV